MYQISSNNNQPKDNDAAITCKKFTTVNLKIIFHNVRRVRSLTGAAFGLTFGSSKCQAAISEIRLVYDKKTLAQTTHIKDKHKQLECGPMPNVMVALPNIGGASVQRRKVWLTPTTRMPCSNAAKTPNPLKFAGVPQTNETISAASWPKFTML